MLLQLSEPKILSTNTEERRFKEIRIENLKGEVLFYLEQHHDIKRDTS